MYYSVWLIEKISILGTFSILWVSILWVWTVLWHIKLSTSSKSILHGSLQKIETTTLQIPNLYRPSRARVREYVMSAKIRVQTMPCFSHLCKAQLLSGPQRQVYRALCAKLFVNFVTLTFKLGTFSLISCNSYVSWR